jgi:hypothetical protein
MLNLPGPRLSVERTGPGPRQARSAAWAVAGLSLALLLTAAALAGEGAGRVGLEVGLRLTARLAFLAFWPCYAAGALVVVFGPGFAPLKRRARALGLTFAAVLAVHLGLVVALCAIGAAPAARVFIVFGPGAVSALFLAAASLEAVSRAIGARGWWILRNLAMNYIAFDFVVDFVRREPLTSARGLVQYLPFAVFAAAGPALRLAAFVKQRRSGTRSPAALRRE